MDIFSMIGQLIAFTAAFYVVIVIIRKDLTYIGNKLFVVSFFLFGLYGLVLFLYEFPISIFINEILIRASLVIVVSGVFFFVLSMQVFAQSKIYLKKPITVFLSIISVVVCVITFIFPYNVYQLYPTIEADKSLVSLLATGVWSFALMIYNSITLFSVIKEFDVSEVKMKTKLNRLLIAQLIGILSPTMSVIGNITGNTIIHAFMFVFLAIPMVLVGLLIRKQ
ncbi:MAG: hypothetical protein GF311_14460 [Candidatus Lokiarchaeota archaeon]|nr:hypothetical protein [Candidatus Lokiarchaeota archaeon]